MAERVERTPENIPQSARSEETYKTPDPRAHYVELDALRGIAILMVLAVHVAFYWSNLAERPLYVPLLGVDLIPLLLFGAFGVNLFFLLSGYLLAWTEEKRKQRGTYSVLNYAKRRALRLVPAYYVAIAVVVLVWPIKPSLGTVALYMTFLHGFIPWYPEALDPAFWSLTPEILFYAVLPLLVLKFTRLWQRVTILALLVVVSLATRLLAANDVFVLLLPSLAENLGQNRMYFFPTTTLYLFLAGVLLRMMVERRNRAGREPGHRQLFAASALTVIPLAVFAVSPYLITDPQPFLPANPAIMIAEAMVILIFASALLGSPVLKPLLRWRPLAFVGEISYSLFLLHTTVIITMSVFLRPVIRPWLRHHGELTVWAAFSAYALAVLAVAGALAYLSYRFIESPFLRYKPK